MLKEDLDELLWCCVDKSLYEKCIFFEAASKEMQEIWYLALYDDGEEDLEIKCVFVQSGAFLRRPMVCLDEC